MPKRTATFRTRTIGCWSRGNRDSSTRSRPAQNMRRNCRSRRGAYGPMITAISFRPCFPSSSNQSGLALNDKLALEQKVLDALTRERTDTGEKIATGALKPTAAEAVERKIEQSESAITG